MHQLDQLDFEEEGEIASANTSQIYPRGELGKIISNHFIGARLQIPFSGSRRTFTKNFNLCINDDGFRGA